MNISKTNKAGFKDYYALAKPGLVYGNLIPFIGGFALGSRGSVNFAVLVGAIIGISFVMGSGCVFNNYIDRDLDGAMERTKDRALVTGKISARNTIFFGICLGLIGFGTLLLHTNLLALATAAVGFFFYVVMYSLWWKRRSPFGVVVGSIAGAVPPVVGYFAAGNRFDLGAILLFLILVFWQMPHFFSIAIYRLDDYANAKVPVLPVQKGMRATKIRMLLYILVFTITALSLTAFGYANYLYFAIVALLCLAWLTLCARGFWIGNDEKDLNENKKWARKMFFLSLIVMTLLFLTLTVTAN